MLNQAFRALGLPVTRMLIQTQNRHCLFRFAEMAWHIYFLIISFFISWMYSKQVTEVGMNILSQMITI